MSVQKRVELVCMLSEGPRPDLAPGVHPYIEVGPLEWSIPYVSRAEGDCPLVDQIRFERVYYIHFDPRVAVAGLGEAERTGTERATDGDDLPLLHPWRP
jgi:hypothetical protein